MFDTLNITFFLNVGLSFEALNSALNSKVFVQQMVGEFACRDALGRLGVQEDIRHISITLEVCH